MSNCRVGMVLDKIFPTDIRVEKEARALAEAGFEVHVLCRSGPGQPQVERFPSLTAHRMSELNTGVLRATLRRTQRPLTFVESAWKRAIRRFALTVRPDVVHVHDLPLVGSTLTALKGLSIPVVADMHENYPAAVRHVRETNPGLRSALGSLLRGYKRWHRYERRMCRRVAHVIAVVEEMRERLIEQHDIPPEKITVITNTEEADFITRFESDPAVLREYQGRFVLLYIGGFGHHRGLDTVIVGMSHLDPNLIDIRLVLVGSTEPKLEDHLRQLIAREGVAERVELVGWQSFDRVPSYIKACSVGLVPHNSNEQTEHTIPHKLFQYMMAGKPVLVSSCRPLARVVRATDAGLVFNAGDPRDFALKVRQLYDDKETRDRLGHNGRRATLEGQWNWKVTGEKLVELYREITGFQSTSETAQNHTGRPRPDTAGRP